jgi:carbon monoxide dehydrogenase subunit G
MAGFELTERIDKGQREVWDFMIDLENMPNWMPTVKRLEKLTEGPMRLGTRFRETRIINNKEHSAEIEITEFEEPDKYAATADEKGIRCTYHYTFAPEDQGTRVNLVAEVQARGLAKLFTPLFVKMMKKMDGGHLADAKRAMESGAAT